VSKLPTEEIEFGSSEKMWATPQAMDGLRVNQVRKKEELSDKAKKGGCSNLREQVMWPTPQARDWKGGSPGTIKEDKNGKPYREAKNSNTKWGLTLDAAVKYQQKKMFPTPQHSDHLANQSETLEAWEKRAKKKKEEGINLQFALRHAVQKDPGEMFPTPAARDWKDTGENTDYEKLAKKSKLAGAVKSEMYPTPRSSIGMSMTMDSVVKAMDNNDRGYKGNLEERVAIEQKMWPTPNASDNRDRGNMSDPAIQRRLAKGKQVGLTMAVKDKPGKGTLNPEWVEWLMGYPPGWTDITDSSESPTSQE